MAAFCEKLVCHEGVNDVTCFRGDIFGTDNCLMVDKERT